MGFDLRRRSAGRGRMAGSNGGHAKFSRHLRVVHKRNLMRGKGPAPVVLAASVVGLLLSGCTASTTELKTVPHDLLATPEQRGLKFEGSIDTWAAAMVECLVAEGWTAAVDESGVGFEVETPDTAQEERYRADLNECLTVTVGQPVEIQSEADLEARYDKLVEQTACLLEAGYVVSDPPSYQSFRDSFETLGDASSFWPLGELGGEDGRIAAQACPFEPW